MSEELSWLKRWLNTLQHLIPLRCLIGRRKQITPETSDVFFRENSVEKLNDILNSLKRDIKEAFYYIPSRKLGSNRHHKMLSPSDKVSMNLILLEEKLKQVICIKQDLMNGGEVGSGEVMMNCKTIVSIIDNLREEVFKSYLELSTSEKLALYQNDKQMSYIFVLLGLMETEVTKFMKSLLPNDPITVLKPFLTTRTSPTILTGKRNRRVKVDRRNFNKDVNFTNKSVKFIAYPVTRKENNCLCCQKKKLVDTALDPIDFSKIDNYSESSVFMSPDGSTNIMTLKLDSLKDIKENYLIYPNEHIYNMKFGHGFLEKVVEQNKLPIVEGEIDSTISENKSWNSEKPPTIDSTVLQFDDSKKVNTRGLKTKESKSYAEEKQVGNNKSIYVTPNMLPQAENSSNIVNFSEKSIQTLQSYTSILLNKMELKSSPPRENSEFTRFLTFSSCRNSNQSDSIWHQSAKQLLETYAK